jgi:ribosomal protein S18 acetylase RimI-like enzyme
VNNPRHGCVSLVPATDADVADHLIDARDSYFANLVEAGLPPSVAERTADEAFAQSFPGGRPAAGHRVFCAEHGGEKAGLLRIGPQSTEQPDRRWVWDIVISKAFRGQGLGRQVMLLAEIEARARGAVELGLNVFAHNTVAVNLYQSLGYEMTSSQHRRQADGSLPVGSHPSRQCR